VTIRSADSWFLTEEKATHGRAQAFCFAHAGGDPRNFLRWQNRLGDAVRLLAVVPPGRGHRATEKSLSSVEEFADGAARAIAAAADRPTVLLGHSLGALVAFEVARRLRHVSAVTDLLASGCAAPSLLPSPRVVATARLQGRKFAEAVGFFGGIPPEVVEAEELYELFLPSLRADFRMVAGYRYHSDEPLAIRVHLVNGIEDPHVRGAVLNGWADECCEEPTRHETVGGHFYFERDPSALIGLLCDLEQVLVSSPSAHQHVELI
jgi:surfactin synthase thioesterase subunit